MFPSIKSDNHVAKETLPSSRVYMPSSCVITCWSPLPINEAKFGEPRAILKAYANKDIKYLPQEDANVLSLIFRIQIII